MLYTNPKPTNPLRRFLFVCLLCLGAAFLICAFLGLLVYSNPLFLLEDPETTIMITITVFIIAGSLFLLDRLIGLVEAFLYRRQARRIPLLMLIALSSLMAITGCDQTSVSTNVKGVVQGTINHPSTGMKATYRNMETEGIKLVMNDEALGHTDIPLGEKFYIINEGVKGLQIKDGKVSVGCSLQITDEKGTVLMNEADLFAGNDVFKKEDATFLRCAVGTGRPMDWDKQYFVKAKFWDKYGDGFIENSVRINIIDTP